MATKPPAPAGTEKRKERQPKAETPASTVAQQPSQERRLVDVDPWAVLLEGLMNMPEEEPAERKPTKGK